IEGNKVNRYDGSTGAPIGDGVFVAAGSGGIQNPRQMVIDPQGNYLYVVRARPDAAGGVLRFQGPNGPNSGAFVDNYITAVDMPIGVALDPAGNLYVSQRDTAKVTRYAPTPPAALQGGDATDFFFLAMAHWQLGDKEK